MVDTRKVKEALSSCLPVGCQWGNILGLLSREVESIEERHPLKPTGSESIARSIDRIREKAMQFFDQIGISDHVERPARAFFKRVERVGESVGLLADVVLNDERSAEYHQLYELLPGSREIQLNLFRDPRLSPVYYPLKAWLDHRFFGVEQIRPRSVSWNGHRVEVHTVPSSSGPREVTLVDVERMDVDPTYVPSNTFDRVADEESSLDDPVARYNCFTLAFHGNNGGSIPLDDNGCVARERLVNTSMAGGIRHNVSYCQYNPQYWSFPSIDDDCYDPPVPIRLCDDPASHILRGGYRFVDVRWEDIRPGDRLIYMNEIAPEHMSEILSDPEKRRTYRRHSLPEFPFMNIGHAAIVVGVKGTEIRVLEKLDAGPAIVSSAFDTFPEYGQHFAVIRGPDVGQNGWMVIEDMTSRTHRGCAGKYPSETDARRPDCQIRQFIKERAERHRWEQIRRRNCRIGRNFDRCSGSM